MTRRRKRQMQIDSDQKNYQMCYRKRGYNTEIEAMAYAKLCNSYERRDLGLRTYICPLCKKFHLTQG